MAKTSEEVLLVINNVKNKKCDGTLYMMSERMAWMPAAKDGIFTISHSYIDIKSQKISPDTKDKVQLQVVLQQGGASTFHFASPESHQRQAEDRDSVKEMLQQMLPKFRLKVSSELEEKNRMLQEDPELFQLYKDLVVSNVITAEEFWTNRLSKKSVENHQQSVGVSAAFLADIKPKSDGCNGLRYDLTPDIIESIFRTYPTVRQKHYENVPDKMTEEEFWTKFFQSHYFHRDRISTSFTSKDLFADCAKTDEQALKKEIETAPKDLLIDLTSMTDNTLDEGYRIDNNDFKPGSNASNASLIKRFNQHSTMVLKSCDHNLTTDLSVTQCGVIVNGNGCNSNHVSQPNNVTDKHARIREKIELEDLEATQSETVAPPLKLARLDPYLHGPTPVIAMQYSTSEDMIRACNAFTQEMMAWQSQLTQVLPTSAAVNVLLELSPGGALMHSCTQQQLQQMVSVDVQQEMRNLYSALCELLRHYWACYPTTSKALEEKLIRMRDTLHRFHTNRLVPFADKVATQHYAFSLIGHMESMIEAANDKFTKWQSRRSQILLKRT